MTWIVLISPPHMLDLLHEHMNKHVKQLITNEINKDILHLSDHKLLSFLKDQ
jgi:protein required for attachment to host cells